MTFRRLSNEQKYQAVAIHCAIMEIDQDDWYKLVVDYFVKNKKRFNDDCTMKGTFEIK